MTSPFVIRAIGDPDTLFKAASLSYGPLSELQRLDPGMTSLEKQQDLVIPAFRGDTRMRYARQTGPSSSSDRTPMQAANGDTVVFDYYAINGSEGAAAPRMPVPPTPPAAARSERRQIQDELVRLQLERDKLLLTIEKVEMQQRERAIHAANLAIAGAEEAGRSGASPTERRSGGGEERLKKTGRHAESPNERIAGAA